MATRAPLIFRFPGRTVAGAKTRGLTEFVDVFPSLCELAGLPTPERLEGTSFVPLLENPSRPWKTAFSQYPRGGKVMGYSMRTNRHRYTEWQSRKPENAGEVLATELYDFETDPDGTANIADLPENAKLVGKLGKQLNPGLRKARP